MTDMTREFLSEREDANGYVTLSPADVQWILEEIDFLRSALREAYNNE